MKKLLLIPFVFAAVSLHAQGVRPMDKPPASTMPRGIARQSTALSAAAHSTEVPLTALPAFSVTDRDGHVVQAASLAKPSHWVLLYDSQDCIPCDKLMAELDASQNAAAQRGASYVIIVNATTADALERVRATYSNLSDATWVADTGHEALTALRLKGAPMLYALHGDAIAFHVPGTLRDTATVKSLASSWLAGTDSAVQAAATTPIAAAAAGHTAAKQ